MAVFLFFCVETGATNDGDDGSGDDDSDDNMGDFFSLIGILIFLTHPLWLARIWPSLIAC